MSVERERLLRLPAVLELFPVSKSAWYKGIRDGKFPAPVKLTEHCVAWRQSDIDALVAKVAAKAA